MNILKKHRAYVTNAAKQNPGTWVEATQESLPESAGTVIAHYLESWSEHPWAGIEAEVYQIASCFVLDLNVARKGANGNERAIHRIETRHALHALREARQIAGEWIASQRPGGARHDAWRRREALVSAVFEATHADYKGISNGERRVMMLDDDGRTVSASLETMDAEKLARRARELRVHEAPQSLGLIEE